MGWSAVGGTWNLLQDPRGGTLFLVEFLWQFPHFMAIAWIYRSQYERAGLRMMTVVEATGQRAGWQAVTTAFLLIPVSCLPALYGPVPGATLYVAWAFLLGAAQFACAVMFFAQRSDTTARLLLAASLVYLPTLLGLLVLVPLA
jgi:protoheme IX farnesyltransferase